MVRITKKYRAKSSRAPFWDYSWSAAYFITICTDNRVCWFGEISDGVLKMSDIGTIVESEWLKTFEMRPDMSLIMGDYVVMPNHFHAILGIGENHYNSQKGKVRRDPGNLVSNEGSINQFGPQSKNVSSIIRGFKTGVTVQARQISVEFKWQAGFHDHIIRDELTYQRVSDYIVNNPLNWSKDEFNGRF
jgi:REP element-mobilizing transposase RayT